MAKKIRVWDGTQWQDVAPSLPYTAIHSAQASMPLTGVDGQVWLDTDGTLAGQDFVPLSGGTMTGNLNVPSINSGPIVGRNKILNGDFGVWQRGTSFSIPSNSNTFCADRWQIQSQGGTAVASQQVFSPASIAGLETQYYLRIVQSAGTANTLIINRIEDVRTLANQNITVSYWAKASATITITTRYDQDFGTGGSSRAANGGSSSTITTSWTRYSSTFTVASISGKTLGSNSYIEFFLYYPNTSGITVELAGVQLEAGNQATPFHTATPNQQTELAACQRYYYRNTSPSAYGHLGGLGLPGTTSVIYMDFVLPQVMRVTPTSIDYGGAVRVIDGSGFITPSSLSASGGSGNIAVVQVNSSAAFTVYRPYYLGDSGAGTAYIGFSAEL